MQISRFFLAAGVMAMALLPAATRAADTDAQVKAREALRSKLDQIETQTTATNTAPTPKATKPTKPVPTTAAAPAQPAPVPAPVNPEPQPQPVAPPPAAAAPVVAPEPAPTQTPPPAARTVQTPLPAETVPSRGLAAPTPPASSSQPMSEAAKPRSSSRSKRTPPPVIAAPAADADKIAAAREQMRQKLDAAVAQEAPEPGPATQPQVTTTAPSQPPPVSEGNAPAAPKKPVPTKPKASVAENSQGPSNAATTPKSQVASKSTPVQPPVTQTTYKPLEGPAAPINASQRQRLDELLSRYRADQISPEQYHQERAKILSQP